MHHRVPHNNATTIQQRRRRATVCSKSSLLTTCVVLAMIIMSSGYYVAQAREIRKRSFAGLGCLGFYDKAKFARLERVCEECYQLYREPDIHSMCRQDCFRNTVFSRCLDALLLTSESKKFDDMVDELYG
ncbi:hypothetical protein GZH46_00223 [Fragariocoptes setiger]|uniref:Ion transport peptide-like n=1 Tax=Fragariocoptes setiger TaxID=1670756 RepID=A0ABQ7SCV4_9ACAR|nr:hypothetical protein GZH46_00223 [Fragariocoptes setiger]